MVKDSHETSASWNTLKCSAYSFYEVFALMSSISVKMLLVVTQTGGNYKCTLKLKQGNQTGSRMVVDSEFIMQLWYIFYKNNARLPEGIELRKSKTSNCT